MAWFNTGTPVHNEKPRDGLDFPPDRFWVQTGQSRDIVFVDVVAGNFKEHQVRLNGNWRNQITCCTPIIEADEVAPCCSVLGAQSAYSVAPTTIVDCSKWIDKKGTARQYELKVLPAKYKTAQKFARKQADLAADGKTMAGRMYKVIRETDKSPAVGDDYEFVRDVDMTKLFELVMFRGKRLAEHIDQADADPAYFDRLSRVLAISRGSDGHVVRKIPAYNYIAVYAPKTPREIREMLNGYVPEPSNNTHGGGYGSAHQTSSYNGPSGARADEDVPF